jgi:mannose-6-phosphate isomerase-like protein (cupin superfamily)
MHIPFSSTSKISTVEGTIWDYEINKEVGVSYQHLAMRGPKSGRYLNRECHEIYFIIEGSAKFFVDGTEYEVEEVEAKDIVVVEPNTPHYIETNNLTYITITRPDWYEEQYEQVD